MHFCKEVGRETEKLLIKKEPPCPTMAENAYSDGNSESRRSWELEVWIKRSIGAKLRPVIFTECCSAT